MSFFGKFCQMRVHESKSYDYMNSVSAVMCVIYINIAAVNEEMLQSIHFFLIIGIIQFFILKALLKCEHQHALSAYK